VIAAGSALRLCPGLSSLSLELPRVAHLMPPILRQHGIFAAAVKTCIRPLAAKGGVVFHALNHPDRVSLRGPATGAARPSAVGVRGKDLKLAPDAILHSSHIVTLLPVERFLAYECPAFAGARRAGTRPWRARHGKDRRNVAQPCCESVRVGGENSEGGKPRPEPRELVLPVNLASRWRVQRAPLNPVACAWRWTRPMAAGAALGKAPISKWRACDAKGRLAGC
jgi:hypothetical protein